MDFESLIKKMTRAAVQGNGSTVVDCFTVDGVYHDVFYGDFMGRNIARLIEDYFHRDGKNFRWDIFDPVEQRDKGYARYIFSYDSRLKNFENKRAIFEGVAICTLSNGKISDYREIVTATTGLALMGFPPAKISKFVAREADALVKRPESASHLTTSSTRS